MPYLGLGLQGLREEKNVKIKSDITPMFLALKYIRKKRKIKTIIT